ncbi:hypothetical protein JH06_4832 [Blastocystis sp. subtype 4]|uniref:hypothetical protein n=1 Tax=Blastocystis sp. subtype 4 TaxID=944170 RepID=UPI000711CE62|nr:hypothetical protein JH06_4832 [Blastocystis sp. subtype 4]KNB44748.1 hypothetical protein JH06_4832 [Blastocystis sp. subtype 4]|eukprot:XP_014528221.1 hypothetical protein JH06_4832 [Blastocystis sp. subtype 4]
MGNVLSDDGVDKEDINEIKMITQATPYCYDDPIWCRVFDLKGYLQYINKSYLHSICLRWSRDMMVNTLETNNFEVFVQHMSEVVTDVPRRLLRSVSNDEYLDAVQKATNALFLTRCFLNTFMKEASDEDLLRIFHVPEITATVVTPTILIRTYGETSFVLIETIVDVIVSHSPQQQTNKMYMEAMGILLTLFSRMLRKAIPYSEDIEHAISPVSPYYSPYFLLDLLFICSGMPISTDPTLTTPKSANDTPVWSSALVMSIIKRMTETSVDALDSDLYKTQEQSKSLLLYPFQLFSLFSSQVNVIAIRSPSATRCQLLLSLLLSVNCATENPFVRTLSRIM